MRRLIAARSLLSAAAKFRERCFYFFRTGDFATRHLAEGFVDSLKFFRRCMIRARPARLDIPNNLSQLLLVFARASPLPV
ncbi:MAG: hypothetical protein WA858_13775 [Xanthobacteraceae bacterium]|jgi:hypothetical protein